MRNGFAIGIGLVAGLATVTFLWAQDPAPAPGAGKAAKGTGKGRGPAGPTGPTPHLADGTPDLSGVWMGSASNSGDISKGLKAGDQVSPAAVGRSADEDAEIAGRSRGQLHAHRRSSRRSVSVENRSDAQHLFHAV